MEQQRIYGTIFFPNEPDNRITGIYLNINKTSLYLEVPYHLIKNPNWQIILGEFNGIDKITFVNCEDGGYDSGAGGTYQKIIISYLIKDFHANSLEDLSFKKIVLTSPVLTKWIIEKESIEMSEGSTFKIPEEKEIVKVAVDSFIVRISLAYNTSFSSNILQTHKVCLVSLECVTLANISVFSNLIRHLKKLILFITHKNPEFNEFVVVDKENNYCSLINTNESLQEYRFTQGIQIQYYDINSSLASIIEKWFEIERLNPIIDLVLEKCYNTEMTGRGFFLNICMGLEIFHNNFGETNDEIVSKQVQINREEISKLITEKELLKWFKEKSNYWNNPTLKDRLMQYEKEIGQIINGVFELTPEEFIDKVKSTRNDIVHRGTYGKHFEGVELFLATKALEFILRLEIMKLIGIDVEQKPTSLTKVAKGSLDVLARINGKGKSILKSL